MKTKLFGLPPNHSPAQLTSHLWAYFFVCFFILPHALAQATLFGQWTTLPQAMPLNPVHIALMHNGKVLVISGSGYKTNTNYLAAVWDPQTDSFVVQSDSYDMFCNGMVIQPDGHPLVAGGTLQSSPAFLGSNKTSTFDPDTQVFTTKRPMAHGRWYPTLVNLGDGQTAIFSGTDENGGTNSTVEIWTPGSGWGTPIDGNWIPPLYPRIHLLPDGSLFYSGPTGSSKMFSGITWTWSGPVAYTNYAGARTYGTSVLLPFTLANNYKPTVMIMGGGNPATATTETIDLSQPIPKWHWGPPMSEPRIEMNAVILPTGKVLALGGSASDELASTASYNADLFDPVTSTFSSAGANAFPRLYHSVALLLPDASVFVAGGNPRPGYWQPDIEIYRPSYLFTTDSSGKVIPALQPSISSAPSTIHYGQTFSIKTPDVASIASIVLIRPGAVTHAFDMEQRLIELPFRTDDNTQTIHATLATNRSLVPPGYYMLFLLNKSGVPSVGAFLLVEP
jgi:hypothetical protein